MAGRKPTLLKESNYLDSRVYQDSLKEHDIHAIVNEMLKIGILEEDKPYAYGLDEVHAESGIMRAHYHIRGYTRCLQSRVSKLRKDSDILSEIQSGQNHLTIVSKMPDSTKGSESAYLAYTHKDKGLRSNQILLKEDIQNAITLYKSKLKRLKENLTSKIEEVSINDFLNSEGCKNKEVSIEDHIYFIKIKLIEYARTYNKRYILSKNNLNSYTYMYLLREVQISPNQILNLITHN